LRHIAAVKFNVARMITRGKRTRQKQIVLAAIVPTAAQARDLETIYLRVVREWGRIAHERIMPAYTRALAAAGVRDSVDDVEGEVDEAAAALQRLVLSLNAQLENWVVRVEEWHRGRFVQLFTPTGVNLDTLLGRGDVRTTLRTVLAENTQLIRSMNEQMRNGVSGAVFRGLTERQTAANVGREIRRIAGIGRRRAELIAADQLQKLTGRLDQERQEQVGIRRFRWRHSQKKNPRPEHIARNGKMYRWDAGVGLSDPPGRAIRCGCRAQPVVDLDTIMNAPE
jgi:SPP1 gp7 family putative phage head morphogenesis protein